ncbi:MAG: hypothetical protein JWM47_4599, partial [Acidimicrobiales bacterium]|nr:hypothetical protein [Acidimicrobiales bacterium]
MRVARASERASEIVNDNYRVFWEKAEAQRKRGLAKGRVRELEMRLARRVA